MAQYKDLMNTIRGLGREEQINKNEELEMALKNFGISDSLIEKVKSVITAEASEEITEETLGEKTIDPVGQEDADVNNDGKVDGTDKYLKKRRAAIAKAMKKEEVEQVDELSKGTMGRYINKAKDSIDTNSWRQGHKEGSKMNPSGRLEKKLTKRHKGIETAVKKLTREEAEQIDEISGKTLASYSTKVANYGPMKDAKTREKHEKGVYTAYKKMKAKDVKVPATMEEVEQIDEKSDPTNPSLWAQAKSLAKQKFDVYPSAYANGWAAKWYKAKGGGWKTAVSEEFELHAERAEGGRKKLGDFATKEQAAAHVEKLEDSGKFPEGHDAVLTHKKTGEKHVYTDDWEKMHEGLMDAIKKVKKSVTDFNKTDLAAQIRKNKSTKGVKLTTESPMGGVAKGSLEGDKHMCATKVFHKEWKEGTTIKTMHADPDEYGLIEWYDVLFDHGIERVMTEDMKILAQESHMNHKKKVTSEEVEELDELSKDTYRSYKYNAMMSDPKDMKQYKNRSKGIETADKKLEQKKEEFELEEGRRGRPPKEGSAAWHAQQQGDQEDEPDQHIINQVKKAADSTESPYHITYKDGSKHPLHHTDAKKVLNRYMASKPAEKEKHQDHIALSHKHMSTFASGA